MEIEITSRLYVTVEEIEDRAMHRFWLLLEEFAENYSWECGCRLEWYEGDEETEPYYYLQREGIEIPIRENVRYEFLTDTGELVGEFPV